MNIATDITFAAQGTDMHYPFTSANALSGKIADIHLVLETADLVPPFFLVWLRAIDTASSIAASDPSSSIAANDSSSADLRITDFNNSVVLDTRLIDFTRSVSSQEGFAIYEWYSNEVYCRMVLYPDVNFSGEHHVRAAIDERCVLVEPYCVKSFSFGNFPVSGDVRLVDGFNVSYAVTLPVDTDTVRPVTTITVNVVPGSGKGRYTNCTDYSNSDLKLINKVGPNSRGNFTLEGKDCYWIAPARQAANHDVIIPSTLVLHNDCAPCYECQDFEDFYRAMKEVHGRAKEAARRISAVRSAYIDSIAKWERERQCVGNNQSRIEIAPLGQGYIGVAGSFCNADRDCKFGLTLRLTLSHSRQKIGIAVPCVTVIGNTNGTTDRRDMVGSWPTWELYWDTVPPGQSVSFQTRFSFSSVGNGDSVTATLLALVAEGNITSSSKAVALFPCGR